MPPATGDLVPEWLRWMRRSGILLLLGLATLCALLSLRQLATYRDASAQAVLFQAAGTCRAEGTPVRSVARGATCTVASATITQVWKVGCGLIVLCYWVDLAAGSQTVAIQVEDWPHWHVLAVGQRIPVRLWNHHIVLARLDRVLAPTAWAPKLEAQRALRLAAPLAVTSVLCVLLAGMLHTRAPRPTPRATPSECAYPAAEPRNTRGC